MTIPPQKGALSHLKIIQYPHWGSMLWCDHTAVSKSAVMLACKTTVTCALTVSMVMRHWAAPLALNYVHGTIATLNDSGC